MVMELAVTVLFCLLLCFFGVKLGLRFFLFFLISMGCLFLMVLFPVKFTYPLAEILEPWIATPVAVPAIVVILCGILLSAGLQVSRRVEVVLGELSEECNRVLGAALGLAIALLLAHFLL